MLAIGVLKARDGVLDAEELAGDLGDHQVRVVVVSDGCQHVAVLDARLDEELLVVADAHKEAAIEVAAQLAERGLVAVDHDHVVPVVGEQPPELRAHVPAANDDDVHSRTFPIRPILPIC